MEKLTKQATRETQTTRAAEQAQSDPVQPETPFEVTREDDIPLSEEKLGAISAGHGYTCPFV